MVCGDFMGWIMRAESDKQGSFSRAHCLELTHVFRQ